MKVPPPPTVASLAKALGTTEDHVRAMARRYRKQATGK